MAQVDTSIYSNFQPVKINSPFENAAMLSQIQQGRNQNRLADIQFKEAARVESERNAESSIAKQYGNTPEYGNQLLKGGHVSAYQDNAKFQTEQDKRAREAEKAKIEGHLQKIGVIGQIMGGVKDQASYDMAKQQVAQILGPDAVARIPPKYDPALIQQKQQEAMSVKEQLEQKWKNLDYQLSTDKFSYQQGNDAANREQQERTSLRTDSRARDFNATNVEENAIKRDEGKRTKDMTTQSQLASFDTMIGTLDRLSTHKGLANATGMMNYLPDRKGSDVSNFKAELESFKSQAFIPMVSQLKGMGALSDAEGKKLTAAVGALDTDVMSESAVRESITRIIADMKAAKLRVQGGQQATSPGGKQDGQTAMSKSGKPIVMRNGQWEYQ